ncbi:hypothetical protein ONS96_007025 [Cadophora gregata f. sp. sojae]|nr:hypothetical protein ONS96_007025 [Cadophora gregata f. sp. sojae]
MNRTYYYIDYRATIDAIKWRVYLLNKQVQGNTIPEIERKEYFCLTCKSEWTQLEVLHRWDMARNGFLCQRCNSVLKHDPDNNKGGHEQSTKYHSQFRFITELLPKIDEVIIPENTFDRAMASQLKVVRDETNPANETAPVDLSASKPTAVRGMANASNTAISVTLTASDGPTEAEIAAEKALKEKTAAQNAMPMHFTHSTVTGEQVKYGPGASTISTSEVDKKTDLDTPSGTAEGTEIDDYFARLRAEQAKEAEREQDEEYETDEDDDEDFEDVVPTGSGAATPTSSTIDSKPTSFPSTGLANILKKGGSASGSGTSTGATSPVTGPATPNEDGRPAKKVKIEYPSLHERDEDESEEDMEFEDV